MNKSLYRNMKPGVTQNRPRNTKEMAHLRPTNATPFNQVPYAPQNWPIRVAHGGRISGPEKKKPAQG